MIEIYLTNNWMMGSSSLTSTQPIIGNYTNITFVQHLLMTFQLAVTSSMAYHSFVFHNDCPYALLPSHGQIKRWTKLKQTEIRLAPSAHRVGPPTQFRVHVRHHFSRFWTSGGGIPTRAPPHIPNHESYTNPSSYKRIYHICYAFTYILKGI